MEAKTEMCFYFHFFCVNLKVLFPINKNKNDKIEDYVDCKLPNNLKTTIDELTE